MTHFASQFKTTLIKSRLRQSYLKKKKKGEARVVRRGRKVQDLEKRPRLSSGNTILPPSVCTVVCEIETIVTHNEGDAVIPVIHLPITLHLVTLVDVDHLKVRP